MTQSQTRKLRAPTPKEDEHDRIDALLDQALELSFPCSDPVAITISGIYYGFRRKAATDSGGKREPPPDAKNWEGKPDKANLLSPNPGTGD
jgi:hypothetical protein